MTPQELKFKQMTEPPVEKLICKLAVPCIISMLVTSFYNMADTFFVGMLNDPIQNAAVTLVYPVMLAFNAVNNLFGVGASSMMSRALGRRDYETVQRASAFGFYCALFSGVLFSVLVALFYEPLLTLLGTPDSIIGWCTNYLKIYFYGIAGFFFYNMLSGVLRGLGDSVSALLYLIVAALLNVVLDLLFVKEMGVAGVALATIISQGISAALCFIHLLWVDAPYKIRIKEIRFHKKSFL